LVNLARQKRTPGPVGSKLNLKHLALQHAVAVWLERTTNAWRAMQALHGAYDFSFEMGESVQHRGNEHIAGDPTDQI